MGSMVAAELLMFIVMPLGFILPLLALYWVIRQAVLSALRKFYRELEDDDQKQKQNPAN